jgi:hypothetical protein
MLKYESNWDFSMRCCDLEKEGSCSLRWDLGQEKDNLWGDDPELEISVDASNADMRQCGVRDRKETFAEHLLRVHAVCAIAFLLLILQRRHSFQLYTRVSEMSCDWSKITHYE